MKKFALFFLIVTVSLGLSAAKIHKVGVHPKVVTVADNRYTISEFENSSASDAVGRTAAVTTIADAVTLLDGHGGIIQVENETPVTADLTIPSNVMLVLPPTAVFNVAATKTLTLNCQVQGVVTNTGGGTVAYGSSYSSPTSFPGPVHEYYVDGGRTDSYTADGSITRPYSTILLATTAINADVLVHAAAGTGAAANYVVHVGAGTYSGNLTITGPRYLRIEGAGVVISGTVLINSGVGSYDHIEFVGQQTGFSEKGPAMTLSGAMTCHRHDDSLIYLSFKGCYITGTLDTDVDGTWVVQYDGCRVNGAVTGTFSAAGHPAILLITHGWNEFAGAISGKLAFYDANNSDFYGAINTTPYYASKFKDCTFSSSVSIVPVTPADSTAINCDSNSLSSLLGRTPTTTGATINNLDNIGTLSTAKTVTLADNYVPVQVNIKSVANPASGYTLGGGYFKVANTTADQANTQLVGVLARASMGKNATDVYAVQSHTTLVDGAESTGNMTAVSGKTILYDNNASGIVTAGLFTLEGQASTTHGAVPRLPNTAYGVWADIVDTNIAAGFILNANNSAVSSGLTLSKMGTGTITNDITLQNGETIKNSTDGTIDLTGIVEMGSTIKVWDQTVCTLQTLITSLTGTAAAPYTIIIPPGYYEAAALGTSPLLLKPWVNLRGMGGTQRMTVFHNITVAFLDAACSAGANRLRIDGIRFETCPMQFIITTGGRYMLVYIDDCAFNNVSPIKTQGSVYGSATTMCNIAFNNCSIEVNVATTQLFELSRVTFKNSTCYGMYFKSSDAYFFGCDIGSGCNFVNDAASVGGWFEFTGCKIDTMALNDPTSESVLKTAFASDNENVQIFGNFHGYTAADSINYWGRIQPGAMYYCHADGKLYVKTGAVGTNTWSKL